MTAFALPAARAHKYTPDRVDGDEAHFARITASIEHQIDDAERRRSEALADPAGPGQAALDRDLDVHRLTARLRVLRRFRGDLCLGRMVPNSGADPVYIGRTGLSDEHGDLLLIDWRSPAAEPFFAATPADPRGLSSRRRYRWASEHIVDYWDESFDGDSTSLALDDDSAFIAGLAVGRTSRMRDVLGTIAADQDAAIRADSAGTVVVDGGPGTGKTVVALHRAAYLLYADPRFGAGRGGVLFVGPHRPYLSYVADVLPALGEEGVRTVTLSDLVEEGAGASPEQGAAVSLLKQSGRMVDAVERAVHAHELPPDQTVLVETPWATVRVHPEDWAEAFDEHDPSSTHNEARDDVWQALVQIVAERVSDVVPDVPVVTIRRAVAADTTLTQAFAEAWPLLEGADLVAHLWSAPRFLRWCAPWLSDADAALLHRDDPRAWTVDDLPLIDAARRLLGDPGIGRTRRERERRTAAERAYRAEIAEYLVSVDYDFEANSTILLGDDAKNSLDDEDALPSVHRDELLGPFAHIVVDEAQELTDAQWRMLLARCPSRSFTVVGDRAQARGGFVGTWQQRLEAAGLRDVRRAELTVNYRTPAEIMAEAEPVIRAVMPDANVPTSIRSSGRPVRRDRVSALPTVLHEWQSMNAEGVACVIVDDATFELPAFVNRDRVRVLTPSLAKGLEFDLVVLIRPDALGGPGSGEHARAVDRYVAMTRATGELVLLG